MSTDLAQYWRQRCPEVTADGFREVMGDEFEKKRFLEAFVRR